MPRLRDLLSGPVPSGYGYIQGSDSDGPTYLTPQGIFDAEENLIGQSGQGNQSRLDYANPIDIQGARGYPVQGQMGRYQLDDGRTVTMQPAGTFAAQQKAARDAQDWQLKQDKMRAEIADLMAKAKQHAEPKAKPQAEWKYDAGSDTWVSPPTAENPEGKVTIPAARANAAKSLGYVAEQFGPVIDKTPQGGILGVSGLVGRMTNSQDARRFDNLKEQLSTELRILFRIPGEGALSDREQAQYGVQLPDVKNDVETNRQILQDIQRRAQIRLGGTQQQPAAPQSVSSPAQLMQDAQAAIARGADRTAVMQRLQERLRGQ